MKHPTIFLTLLSVLMMLVACSNKSGLAAPVGNSEIKTTKAPAKVAYSIEKLTFSV